MSDIAWTESRETQLKELWGEGHSCSEIAATLGGITRNAVIGKIHRLGIAGGVRPSSVSRQRRTYSTLPFVQRERAPTPPRPKRVKAVEPPSLNLSLFDLRDATEERPGTCKWAHGDAAPYLFCGNPTTEKSRYCEFHDAIAYPARRAASPTIGNRVA